MDKRSVVLVTGANSGMGKAASLALAELGFSVVMLCRDPERGKKAVEEIKEKSGNERVELMLCDLASIGSIESSCKLFLETHSRLDVLINNAGVLKIKRHETADGIELHFGVNHLGHFLLTNRLLPLLKSSAPSRIIVVSSCAHKTGRIHFDDINLENNYNVWRGYAQSKFANVLFTYGLADKLKGTGVTVNCLDPGVVATDIIVNRKTGLGSGIVRLQRKFFMSPEKGAETAVYLATSPEVEGVTGKFFYNKKEVRSCSRSYDKKEAEILWDLSERLSGLKPGDRGGSTVTEHVFEEQNDTGESVPL